jgi:hypothetical protein
MSAGLDGSEWATLVRAGVVAAAAATACHSARPESAPVAGAAAAACPPPTGTLPPSATAAGLAGTYRLQVVPTTGPTTGRMVEAGLQLADIADPAAREVHLMGITDSTSRYALTGTSDLDPAAVGAVATGEVSAADPAAPGVLVIERHPPAPGGPAEIILRLGSEANRRDRVRYDGGYFALVVRGIGPRGFTGTWSSGGGGPTVGGYFCAERTAGGS